MQILLVRKGYTHTVLMPVVKFEVWVAGMRMERDDFVISGVNGNFDVLLRYNFEKYIMAHPIQEIILVRLEREEGGREEGDGI